MANRFRAVTAHDTYGEGSAERRLDARSGRYVWDVSYSWGKRDTIVPATRDERSEVRKVIEREIAAFAEVARTQNWRAA